MAIGNQYRVRNNHPATQYENTVDVSRNRVTTIATVSIRLSHDASRGTNVLRNGFLWKKFSTRCQIGTYSYNNVTPLRMCFLSVTDNMYRISSNLHISGAGGGKNCQITTDNLDPHPNLEWEGSCDVSCRSGLQYVTVHTYVGRYNIGYLKSTHEKYRHLGYDPPIDPIDDSVHQTIRPGTRSLKNVRVLGERTPFRTRDNNTSRN